MSAHTPGPWGITNVQYADHVARALIELNGYEYVCRPVLRDGHADLEFKNYQADAQLITAAPKMLAALRRAAMALAFAAESSAAMRDDYEAVSAAIAAAIGTSA